MGYENKFHYERKRVARRIAKRLRSHPAEPVALRWFELRYFRAHGHEEQMLKRLHEPVAPQVKRPPLLVSGGRLLLIIQEYIRAA